MKIEAERDTDGEPAITLSEVYSGIGIRTDMGLFGIAERDGGIEVMLEGKTVWASHEIVKDPLSPGGPGVILPDGSGAFVASYPLPKNHWLYAEGHNEPPAPMRTGLGAKRNELADQIREAAKFAVRASTMNGKESDFDPDAMVQNFIVGLLGPWTDGQSRLCPEIE